jgi:hypothetical protein
MRYLSKKKIETEYYESIETLLLYNWDRFCSTKDNNWFIVGYDGRQTKISNPKLTQLEADLQDEYFTEVNDDSYTRKIQKWAKVDNLRTKYAVVTAILERMWQGFADNDMTTRHEFIKELEKWRFKMPAINTIAGDKEELQRIYQEVQGIKTQIKLIHDELKDDGVQEKRSLNFQLKLMTKAFEFNVPLNAKELTVKEFIELGRELNKLSKKN